MPSLPPLAWKQEQSAVTPPGTQSKHALLDVLPAITYGAGLAFCFLGVSVLVDMLLASIRTITGKINQKQVKGSSRLQTTSFWNGTVARFTLLALGTSAPQIMVSTLEALKNDSYSGDLGPNTVIGSAAFNLLISVAACAAAIPSSEIRAVASEPLLFVAVAVAILPYAWLLVIVDIFSPGVIDVSESATTLCLLPCLAAASYWCDKLFVKRDEQRLFDASASRPCPAAAASELPGPLNFEQGGLLGLEAGVLPTAPAAPASADADRFGPTEASAGIITFNKDLEEVQCGLEKLDVAMAVLRRGGRCGNVSCRYRTRALSAVPGYDFAQTDGELHFSDGQGEAFIQLSILPRRPGQQKVEFQLVLEQATGGATFNPDMDGHGDQLLLTVAVKTERQACLDRGVSSRSLEAIDRVVSLNGMQRGKASWYEQIRVSFLCGDEGVNEDASTSAMERASKSVSTKLHYPWRCFYSIAVPPPEFCGGWLCFAAALVHIGVLAAVVIDLAELFSSATGVQRSSIALTALALGTSMPTLCTARMLARREADADACMLQVMGSTSMNVLLGLGLPWTIGSIHWAVNGATETWRMKYPEVAARHPGGALVASDNVSFNAASFCVVGMLALLVTRVRRRVYGGELGGPFAAKVSSSLLLVSLWTYYVLVNVWKAEHPEASPELQLSTAAWSLAAVCCVCAAVVPCVWLIEKSFFSDVGEPAVTDDKEKELPPEGFLSPKAGRQRELPARQLEQLQALEAQQRPKKGEARRERAGALWAWLRDLHCWSRLPCVRSATAGGSS